eukprot:1598495-Amphidinium_carterae.1
MNKKSKRELACGFGESALTRLGCRSLSQNYDVGSLDEPSTLHSAASTIPGEEGTKTKVEGS